MFKCFINTFLKLVMHFKFTNILDMHIKLFIVVRRHIKFENDYYELLKITIDNKTGF